jgi:hypothetical protein
LKLRACSVARSTQNAEGAKHAAQRYFEQAVHIVRLATERDACAPVRSRIALAGIDGRTLGSSVGADASEQLDRIAPQPHLTLGPEHEQQHSKVLT